MRDMTTAGALQGLAGDRAHVAWATLVDRHGPDVWRMITSRSYDQHAAEDIFQEFWLNLPKAAASFQPAHTDVERNARAWILRVAYTSTIDYLRRQRSRLGHTSAFDELTSEHHQADLHHLDEAETQHEQQQLNNRVQDVIKTLPEGYRRPLLLYVVGGLSYDDVASDLRCTVNNARVRVHRGLKRVREALGLTTGDNDKPDKQLMSLLVPLGFIMPSVPAFPLAMSVPIPIAAKSVIASSWTQSPWLSLAVATVGGVGVVGGIHHYYAQPTEVTAPVVQQQTAVPSYEQGYVLDDFERTNTLYQGHSYDATFPKLSITTAPPSNAKTTTTHDKVMRFEWTSANTIWIDASLLRSERAKAQQFHSIKNASITLSVWLPRHSPLKHLGVRMIDAEGEVFEFRHLLPARVAEQWQDITIPVTAVNGKHWQTNKDENSTIDFPLTFYGFGVAFAAASAQTNHYFYIDDVRFHVEP